MKADQIYTAMLPNINTREWKHVYEVYLHDMNYEYVYSTTYTI